MPLLLITTDLLIQSRVAAACQRGGLPPPTTCSPQGVAALDKETSDAYRLAILDLSTPGLDVEEAVSTLRRLLPGSARIIAFAPHVHTAKLTAARNAGCDQVLSRGQFDRDLIEELEMLTKDQQERRRYEERMLALRDQRSLVQDALEEGLERGMERGVEKGIEKGMEKGEHIGRIHAYERLLKRPLTPTDDLVELSPDTLRRRADELEAELTNH